MRRHRFMIVEHKEPKSPRFEDVVIPIHTLLGTYHWARLDSNHVFVAGYYEVGNHNVLQSHPRVSVLPILSSSKKLKVAAKPQHWQALSLALNLSEEHTTADMLEVAEERYGSVFSSEK